MIRILFAEGNSIQTTKYSIANIYTLSENVNIKVLCVAIYQTRHAVADMVEAPFVFMLIIAGRTRADFEKKGCLPGIELSHIVT